MRARGTASSRVADVPWIWWVLGRVVSLGLGGLAIVLVNKNVLFDTTLYAHWAHGTLTGTRVPYRDFAWEYPPGALPIMLLPGVYAPFMHDGRGSAYLWLYGAVWVVFMLGIDAAVLRSLLRRTGRARHHPAVTVWLWGLPVLGALSWARYDLLPAAAAAAAVLAAGLGTSGLAGTLAGVGATLKLWPALLAAVQPTSRGVGAALARAAAVVASAAGVTFALTGNTGFGQVLSYQSRRGLQCESLAALPLLWLRHLHMAAYHTRVRFGAWEVTGAHVELIAVFTTAAYAAGLLVLGLAHWRLLRSHGRTNAAHITAVAVLMLTLVTNKVFSPQYLLWLLGVLAAACVLDPETWRPFVPWVIFACGLTALAFPWFYDDIVGDGWFGLLALTARDTVVAGLAVRVARLMLQRMRVGGRHSGLEPAPVHAATMPEARDTA